MIYKVKAKFIQKQSKEFLKLLTDGTIEKQQPDGPYIVDAMNKAKIDNEGFVNWTEFCLCPTPLYHERSTVYDKFFKDFQTEEVDKQLNFEGKSFINSISK